MERRTKRMVRFTKLGVLRNLMAVVSLQGSSRTAPVANLNGAAGDKKNKRLRCSQVNDAAYPCERWLVRRAPVRRPDEEILQ
jgi:hypothetical protein